MTLEKHTCITVCYSFNRPFSPKDHLQETLKLYKSNLSYLLKQTLIIVMIIRPTILLDYYLFGRKKWFAGTSPLKHDCFFFICTNINVRDYNAISRQEISKKNFISINSICMCMSDWNQN